MQFILFFAVFYAFIVFVQYWQIIKLLILNPFHKSQHVFCSADEIPKSMQGQLAYGMKELKALGFKASHFVKHQEFYASIKSPKYSAILFSPAHNCYAQLENNLNPDAVRPFKIVFIQYYSNIALMGFYAEAHSIVDGYENFHCFDNNEVNLSKRFDAFLADISNKETHMKLGDRLVLNKNQHIERSNKLAAGYIDFLEDKHYVYEKKEKYYFKFMPAVKIATKLKKEFNSINKDELLAKNLLKNHPNYLLAPEVDAYLRHEKILNHPNFSKWVKTLLFVISAVLFVLLFGSTFDFSFALFLLPVLILHEAGHLLAMKVFGYNDLQVLFMPFGAAAIGKEKANTSVLKKVIIYLAGPLPGILLALGLMFVPSVFEISWVTSLVIILVIINYLNLLPFMPLDGGQIINHVLLGRYPVAQFLFSLVSVIIFILAAYYSDDQILAVFAIFISFTLINQFSNLKTLRVLTKETFKNKTQLIAKIFNQLNKKPIRYLQKQQTVQTLLPILQQPKAKLHEIILGLLLYFAAFFGPLYVVNMHTDGLLTILYQASWGDYEPDNEKWSPEYWKKEVAQQETPQQKFNTYTEMLEFTSDGFAPIYKPLLEDALKLAKANRFTTQEKYPALLKAHILMNLSEFNEPTEINDTLLTELSQIENGNHLEYANTLVLLYSYGYQKNALENLLLAKDIYQRHNDQDNMNTVLSSLAKVYEQNENYNMAEQTLVQLIESSTDGFNHIKLASFFMRNNRLVEALKSCQITLGYFEKDVPSMTNFYKNQCAWIALLDHKYNLADDYFNQSHIFEKQQMESLSDEDADMFATIDYKYHQNMMALEWSRGEKEKAKNHLSQLRQLKSKNEYLDIVETIKLIRENPNNEFSKPDKKSLLILNAYDDLK